MNVMLSLLNVGFLRDLYDQLCILGPTRPTCGSSLTTVGLHQAIASCLKAIFECRLVFCLAAQGVGSNSSIIEAHDMNRKRLASPGLCSGRSNYNPGMA